MTATTCSFPWDRRAVSGLVTSGSRLGGSIFSGGDLMKSTNNHVTLEQHLHDWGETTATIAARELGISTTTARKRLRLAVERGGCIQWRSRSTGEIRYAVREEVT